MKNYGLIKEKIDTRQWYLGANSPINLDVIQENGDWRKYLPVFEKQKYNSLETMSCVSQSANNVLEILFKKLFETDLNFSDRALSKMSGTMKTGNTLHAVAETARTKGLVFEEDWTFTDKSVPLTWEHYYEDIPDDILLKADNFGKKIKITHDWVHKDDFAEALKYTPLQITVNAWYQKDGIYYNVVDYENHAVVLINIDRDGYYYILDSYEPYIKILRPDYKLGIYAKRFNICKLDNMSYEIKDNYLYQLVEGNGGFALGLDGQLVIDSLDKILATFISRNDGDIEYKTIKVRQDFWDNFDKVNLKGESV